MVAEAAEVEDAAVVVAAVAVAAVAVGAIGRIVFQQDCKSRVIFLFY
jgi:hypothetical protein